MGLLVRTLSLRQHGRVQDPADRLENGPSDDGRGVRSPGRAPGGLLVVGAVAALVLVAAPWSSGTPADPPLPVRPTAAPEHPAPTETDLASMHHRGRAVQARYEMIRTVPTSYRRAAEEASMRGGRQTPPEFFLALAFNRTLYGTMLTGDTGRAFAARGPVQWDLAEFRRFAVPGHSDPAVPLDAFLAVDEALRDGEQAGFSDPFSAAIALGATPDHARADDETFAILSSPRRPLN